MIVDQEFLKLVISIVGITLFGMLAHRFKQPLLIGYIIAGVLLSVFGLQKYMDSPEMEHMAKLGLTLLLFIVGLKLDISVIKNMGNSFKIGIAQIFITVVLGFVLSVSLNFNLITSLYISMALTFSSTIVIVKMLSDKGELDSLYGRINLGVLILQDIVAIIFMMIISCFSKQEGQSIGKNLINMAEYGLLTALIIFAMVKFIFPVYLTKWAKSPELLMVISIGFAVLLAYICEMGGLSMEVGAFLAGATLAPFKEYRYTISSKLTGLRDFMLIFFFLNLGIDFDISGLSGVFYKAIIFIIFTMFIKPFIIIFIMEKIGYQKRTAFLSGSSLSQISEFSIILITFGMSVGQVDKNVLEMIMLILIFSIFASSYYINYSQQLYEILSKNIKFWKENNVPLMDTEDKEYMIKDFYNIVIIGMGDFGTILSHKLKENGYKVLEMDFDPTIVNERSKLGKNIIYGDAEDFDIINQLSLGKTKWVISAVHIFNVNSVLVKNLKLLGYKGYIAVSTSLTCSEEMKNIKGVDVIFEPYLNAVNEAVNVINNHE